MFVDWRFIFVVVLLNLTAVLCAPKYIVNPDSTILSKYSLIDCSSSTSGSEQKCCSMTQFFVKGSWYDTTFETNFSVNTSCYLRITGSVWIRIESDGMPNHPYSSGPAYVGPQNYDYLILIDQPTITDQGYQDPCNSTTLGFGVIGFATNGVPIFSPLSIDSVDPYKPPAGYVPEGLDICLAHPNAKYMYHYHLASPCMLGYSPDYSIGNTGCYDGVCSSLYESQFYDGDGDYAAHVCVSTSSMTCVKGVGFVNGSSETVIGISLDGNLFYGPYEVDGSSVSGLDNCNGKYVNETYKYYATNTFPYLIGCYGPGVYDAPTPTCTANPSSSSESDTSAKFPISAVDNLETAEEIPPNIIFISIDDWGWNDVGFQSTDLSFATPNIDKLFSEGILLTSYYAQPMCTPSRISLLTGKSIARLGLQTASFSPRSSSSVPLSLTFLSQELQAAGYHTAMVGKWHLGHDDWAATPNSRGFDSFTGFWASGSIDYFNKTTEVSGNWYFDFWNNYTVANMNTDQSTLTTYLYEQKVEEIIEDHTNWYGSGTDRVKPLFLYYAMQNVHAPLETLPELLDSDHPCASIRNINRANFCAMVSLADEAIGNFTQKLKDLGMYKNTLLVISSDNGANPSAGGYNYPLRGSKETYFEGGVRSLAALWGGYLPLSTAGTTYDGLLHVSDWYPTFLGLANRVATSECDDFDGYDVYSSIINNQPSPRSEILFTYNDDEQEYVLRVGDLKLITGATNGSYDQVISVPSTPKSPHYSFGTQSNFSYLFNITNDPYEQDNLYYSFPDLVTFMFDKLSEYESIITPPVSIPLTPAAIKTAEQTGALSPWNDSRPSSSQTCWISASSSSSSNIVSDFQLSSPSKSLSSSKFLRHN